jgi:hypothetical protein
MYQESIEQLFIITHMSSFFVLIGLYYYLFHSIWFIDSKVSQYIPIFKGVFCFLSVFFALTSLIIGFFIGWMFFIIFLFSLISFGSFTFFIFKKSFAYNN